MALKEYQIKKIEQSSINSIKFRSFNNKNEDPAIISTLKLDQKGKDHEIRHEIEARMSDVKRRKYMEESNK